jgi:hypothetical protein
MKTNRLTALIVAGFMAVFVLSGPSLAGEMTITGEVNESYQIVDSAGNVYDVAENEAGDHIVTNLVGQKVSVTGVVEAEGDIKTITVSSYKVLEE